MTIDNCVDRFLLEDRSCHFYGKSRDCNAFQQHVYCGYITCENINFSLGHFTKFKSNDQINLDRAHYPLQNEL